VEEPGEGWSLDGDTLLLPTLCAVASRVDLESLRDRLYTSSALEDQARDEQLLIVYLSACRRLGMRCLFEPNDLLAGDCFAAVVDNLRELYALSRAKARGLAGEECQVAFDYVNTAVVASRTTTGEAAPGAAAAAASTRVSNAAAAAAAAAEGVPGMDGIPAPLTYFEHLALYTGAVSPTAVGPDGRVRLWRHLLTFDNAYVAHVGSTAPAARAASRRIASARRRAATSGDVDEQLQLLHMLVAPAAGMVIARRKLVRALVRAGLPPHLRGYLWCRCAGLTVSTLNPYVLYDPAAQRAPLHDAPAPALAHADAVLPPAVEASTWERRKDVVTGRADRHMPLPALPSLPTATPPASYIGGGLAAALGARVGEAAGAATVAPADCFVPSDALAHDLRQLSYYDFLTTLNADSLEAHRQLPPRLASVLAALRREIRGWRAGGGGGGLPQVASPLPGARSPPPPSAASPTSPPRTLPDDHMAPDRFAMWWHGRRVGPANADTVVQVNKDLPRTVPHLQMLEPSRVRVSRRVVFDHALLAALRRGDGAYSQADVDDGLVVTVRHIYAPRRVVEAARLPGAEASSGVVTQVAHTVADAMSPLDRPATSLQFAYSAQAASKIAASALAATPPARLAAARGSTAAALVAAAAAGHPAPAPVAADTADAGDLAPDAVRAALKAARAVVHVSEGALRRLLLAFSSHSPVLDFVQGLPFVAAHALRWLGEADAFALFTALLHAVVPADYYTDCTAGVVRDQKVVEELLSCNPDLAPLLDHLATLSAAPRSTVLGLIQSATLQWFICLFTVPFTPAFTDRIWDSLLCEGDAVLFRATLAILRTAMPALMGTNELHVAMEALRACHTVTYQPAAFAALFDCWLWPLPPPGELAAAAHMALEVSKAAANPSAVPAVLQLQHHAPRTPAQGGGGAGGGVGRRTAPAIGVIAESPEEEGDGGEGGGSRFAAPPGRRPASAALPASPPLSPPAPFVPGSAAAAPAVTDGDVPQRGRRSNSDTALPPSRAGALPVTSPRDVATRPSPAPSPPPVTTPPGGGGAPSGTRNTRASFASFRSLVSSLNPWNVDTSGTGVPPAILHAGSVTVVSGGSRPALLEDAGGSPGRHGYGGSAGSSGSGAGGGSGGGGGVSLGIGPPGVAASGGGGADSRRASFGGLSGGGGRPRPPRRSCLRPARLQRRGAAACRDAHQPLWLQRCNQHGAAAGSRRRQVAGPGRSRKRQRGRRQWRWGQQWRRYWRCHWRHPVAVDRVVRVWHVRAVPDSAPAAGGPRGWRHRRGRRERRGRVGGGG